MPRLSRQAHPQLSPAQLSPHCPLKPEGHDDLSQPHPLSMMVFVGLMSLPRSIFAEILLFALPPTIVVYPAPLYQHFPL